MLNSEIHSENLSLLDKTLQILINSQTLSLHFNDLQIKLLGDSAKKVKFTNMDNSSLDALFNDAYSVPSQKTKNLIKINELLLYLDSNNLIHLIDNNHLRITYQGIIQHSKGYLFTYKSEEKTKNRLDTFDKFQRSSARRMLWINGAIALGTAVAMVYYLLEMISTPYCFCK